MYQVLFQAWEYNREQNKEKPYLYGAPILVCGLIDNKCKVWELVKSILEKKQSRDGGQGCLLGREGREASLIKRDRREVSRSQTFI